MTDVEVLHTSQLGAAGVGAVRHLLATAFGGEFDDGNFEHALGGMHALVREDGELVAHGAVVLRRLIHEGKALRTGYVEAVGVRPDRWRAGLGVRVMTALHSVLRGGYQLGALAASHAALEFYPALGWQLWPGPLSALTPRGIEPTPDDSGDVFVLPISVDLQPERELICDWRDGDLW